MLTVRPHVVALYAMVAVLAAAFPVFIAASGTGGASDDVLEFERYARLLVNGSVPYRDFQVEYPPGAFAPWVAAGPFGPADDYARRFVLAMGLASVVCALLTTATVRRLHVPAGRSAFAIGAAVATPVLLGAFAYQRFDYWPAMLVAAALCAFAFERFTLVGAAIGVGMAAKLWPILVLPTTILAAPGRWRTIGLAFAIAVGVLFMPAVLLAPAEVAASVRDQVSRPLQIESLGGSVVIAADAVEGSSFTPVWANRSWAIGGATARPLAVATGILGGLVVAALVVGAVRRRPRDGPDAWLLIRTSAGIVVAIIAFGRVLSPQYLVWLMPFGPLLIASRRRDDVAAGLLITLAIALTGVEFPGYYYDLLPHPTATSAGVLLGRNVMLLAASIVLVRSIHSHHGSD
jgi:hypothetical protein